MTLPHWSISTHITVVDGVVLGLRSKRKQEQTRRRRVWRTDREELLGLSAQNTGLSFTVVERAPLWVATGPEDRHLIDWEIPTGQVWLARRPVGGFTQYREHNGITNAVICSVRAIEPREREVWTGYLWHEFFHALGVPDAPSTAPFVPPGTDVSGPEGGIMNYRGPAREKATMTDWAYVRQVYGR